MVALTLLVAANVIFFVPTVTFASDVTPVMLAVGVREIEVVYVVLAVLTGPTKDRVKTVPFEAGGSSREIVFEPQQDTILVG